MKPHMRVRSKDHGKVKLKYFFFTVTGEYHEQIRVRIRVESKSKDSVHIEYEASIRNFSFMEISIDGTRREAFSNIRKKIIKQYKILSRIILGMRKETLRDIMESGWED